MINEEDKNAIIEAFKQFNEILYDNPERALEMAIEAYNLAQYGDIGLQTNTQIASSGLRKISKILKRIEE